MEVKTLLINIEFCLDQKAIRYVPSKQKYIEWEKYPEKLPIYITIIAYFECRNEPIENIDHNLKTKNISTETCL